MQSLKVLAVAAAMTVALMVFGGGTAAATKLCTDSACTVVYPAGSTVHKVTKVEEKIKSNGSTIAVCTSSTIHYTTANKEGATVSGSLTSFTHSGCSQTTHTVKNGSISIQWTSGNNGTVSGSGSETTYAIFGVSCTYGTGEGTHLGSVTGGSAPGLKIATTLTKTAGGFLCPGTVVWETEYVIDAPHALYVGA